MNLQAFNGRVSPSVSVTFHCNVVGFGQDSTVVSWLVQVSASFGDFRFPTRASGVHRSQCNARIAISRPVLGHFRFTCAPFIASRDVAMGLAHESMGELCFQDRPVQGVYIVRWVMCLLANGGVVRVVFGRRVSSQRSR